MKGGEGRGGRTGGAENRAGSYFVLITHSVIFYK